MTDPFAQLEADLRRAAARRARLGGIAALPSPPARVVFAVATAAAAVALVVAAVGTLRLPGEGEVAAPVPGADVSCDAESPPAVIGRTFAVLDGPPPPTQDVPDHVFERVAADPPGGPMAKLWRDHGRIAREGEGRRYWVIPGLAGTCERPQPAVCVVYVDADLGLTACVEVARVADGTPVAAGPLGPNRWFTAALVPDSTELVLLKGVETYYPSGEGNIFEARYEATAEQHESAELEFVSRAASERNAERGGCPGSPVSITDAPPTDWLLRVLPMFREGGTALDGPFWIESFGEYPERVVNLHAGNGRRLDPVAGLRVAAAPVAHVAGPPGCAPLREPDPGTDRPGVCVVASRGDGAATERFPICWTLEVVMQGEAFDVVAIDDERALVHGVLAAGIRDAAIVPDEGPPVPLRRSGQYFYAEPRPEVLHPGFVVRYTDEEGDSIESRPQVGRRGG